MIELHAVKLEEASECANLVDEARREFVLWTY